MADVAPVSTPISYYGENAHIVSWSALNGTNTQGTPIEMAGSSIRSVHISGTFDGATVTLKGSNNGSSFIVLTDPQGNAISKTTEAIEAVTESTRLMRPEVASAGANTSINVHMVLVRRGR